MHFLSLIRLCSAIQSLGSQQFVAPSTSTGSGIEERTVSLNSNGNPSAFSGSSEIACMLHIGCFKPVDGFRPTLLVETGADKNLVNPLQCFSMCVKSGFKIGAVKSQFCSCASSVTSSFTRHPDSSCNQNCDAEFQNPICGGEPDFWNLYMCYTYELLGSFAVDPWRNIAFKTVAVNWLVEERPYVNSSTLEETNFLYASDVGSGAPLPQYHLRQTDGVNPLSNMAYTGLNFDVDSSRLVGLMIPANIGRTSLSASFSYKLVIIDIDTRDVRYPKISITARSMYTDTVSKQDIFSTSESAASNFMLGNNANGMISRNGIDTYIFSVPYGSVDYSPSSLKSKLLFVDVSSKATVGNVFFTAPLDCIVTQMAINDFYGDVAILASRQGSVQFIAIATVYRDLNTGILTVHSYWDPSGLNPVYVAAVSDTQNLNLLAGVSASIPMQNMSCHGIMLYDTVNGGNRYSDDRQLLLNQPSSDSDVRNGSIPSVVCFDIRNQGFLQLWGSANGTAKTIRNGTVDVAISMNIYQNDPGFPFTLTRPEMTTCAISMSGLTVTVKFDSVTLMGAQAIDSDNNGVPDNIDYSTQVITSSPASNCFSNTTLPLLKGAGCYFSQSDTLVVQLDRQLSSLSFGDALCIKPHFLCRYQGGQWSTYATGCCTVTLPTNLVPPKPVLVAKPSLTVDVCSDISLDVSDSINCGRGCSFIWNLTSIKDVATVTGMGSMTYGKSVLSQFSSAINHHLKSNAKSSVMIPSSMLAKNGFHYFEVTIVSSWKLNATLPITVQKLSEAAPTVSIQGDLALVQTQGSEYSITAIGKASSCESSGSTSVGLGYSWSYSNCSLVLSKNQAIVSNQNSVRIPSGSHKCPNNVAWYDNGKVACEKCLVSVGVYLTSNPSKISTQTMSVLIVKSSVLARCYNPDFALVTRGPIWFINCGNSIDNDNPTSSSFQGNFDISCLKDNLQPCFSNPGLDPNLLDPPACNVDYTQPRIVGDGGVLYPQVLFTSSQGYCRLGRGIMAVNTNLLNVGIFNFKIDVIQFDNLRRDSKQISVQLTDIPLPKISMVIVGSILTKYPVSSTIKVDASTTMDMNTVSDVVYTWTLLAKQLNLLYDPDAAQRALSRGQTYTVPQFTYSPVSILSDCKAIGKAQWNSESPTIQILPNCLKTATDYTIRLNITWYQPINGNPTHLATYSELMFSTATGPPRSGSLTVEAVNPQFTSCNYPKILTASNWVSEDSPLTYRFGYIVDTGTMMKYWYTDTSQQATTFSGLIPCGSESDGFFKTVFVQVTSSTGEYAYHFLRVVSAPPSDIHLASATMITEAQNLVQSDPAQAFSNYMTAISLSASVTNTTNTINEVVSSVGQAVCASVDCGDRKLVFLNNLATTVKATATALTPEIKESMISTVEVNVNQIAFGDSSAVGKTQNILTSMSTLLGDLGATKPVTSSNQPYNSLIATTRRTGPVFHEPSTRLLSETELRIHHSVPDSTNHYINDCHEVFCDTTNVMCILEVLSGHHLLTCCDAQNQETECFDPPCWFHGNRCQEEFDGISSAPSRLLSDSLMDAPTSLEDQLYALEIADAGPVADSKLAQDKNDKTTAETRAAEQSWQDYVSTLQPSIQTILWEQHNATLKADLDIQAESAINCSSILTRIHAARDILARKIINSLVKNQPPFVFETPLFNITIGKTTDMSAALPAFKFPSKYTVPSNSPDNPTANNPVTGFSYYYVQYFSDVYSWSLNKPISSESTVVSLTVMKANPDIPLVVSPNDEPIRIFADLDMRTLATCKYWDRLSSLPGGGWTGDNVVNDGAGCLAKTWGDVGVFMNAKNILPVPVGIASSGDDSSNLGYVKRKSFTILVIEMFVIITTLIMVLVFYKVDSMMKRPSLSVHLDGDGITTPLRIDDPIPYHRRNDGLVIFTFRTYWNVLKCSHVLLSPLTFHPVYRRPMKAAATSVMITTCMAVVSLLIDPNAPVPNLVSLSVVASLISYPFYLIFRFMVANRPSSSQSISIKRMVPVLIPNRAVPLRPIPFPGSPRTSNEFLSNPPTPKSSEIRLFPKRQTSPHSPITESPIPPPPPIDENASGFIRRVQDIYAYRAAIEQEKAVIQESAANKAKPVPQWVHNSTIIVLWSYTIVWFAMTSVLVGIQTTNFTTKDTEVIWFISTFLALMIVCLILDNVRCMLVTLQELWKYGQRRPSTQVRPVEPPIAQMIEKPFLPTRTVSPVPPIPIIREPSIPPPPSSRSSSWVTRRTNNNFDDLLPGRIQVIGPEPVAIKEPEGPPPPRPSSLSPLEPLGTSRRASSTIPISKPS